ncbi:hypothetical protein ABLAC_28480 [Acinetobacter baumannii LAC-4]|nr:hypothetical protein [Acinetobacter baumannii]AIY38203.1 hypothetical protein ABLAC_28480 [Acinetobacter baumannii LAC-4]
MPENFKFSLVKEARKSDQEIYEEVISHLLASSERVINGDYSELKGDEAEISKRIKYYEHIHEGMNSIDDLKKQIYLDLNILKPVLKEVEEDLRKLFSEKRTIMITDSSFWNDNKKIKKFFDNTKIVGKST